jgi:4-oxalocrotonate tautomerase
MPLVEVTLAQGRSPEQLRALLHELHAAVVRAVDAPDASVRVVIREVPPTHWSSGDVTLAERRVRQTEVEPGPSGTVPGASGTAESGGRGDRTDPAGDASA